MKNIIKNLIIGILITFILVGCTSAKNELKNIGISYTEEDYFKYGVYKNDITVLKLFYKAGMDINTKEVQGNTAIKYAIEKDYFNTIKYLVKEQAAGISKNDLIDYTVYHYIGDDKKMMDIVSYLLKNKAIFSNKNFDACNCESSNIINKEVCNIYKINFAIAMLFAQDGLNKNDATYMLKKLYENFSTHLKNIRNTQTANNIDTKRVAIETKKAMKLANELLKNGADITEAYRALDLGEWDKGDWMIDFIQLAIDNGIDINSQVFYRKSPIIFQIIYGFKDISDIKNTVKFLLENGADITLKQQYGSIWNKNSIFAFCNYTPNLVEKNRPDAFYPEICKSKSNEFDLLKTLFINPKKYNKSIKEVKNINLF